MSLSRGRQVTQIRNPPDPNPDDQTNELQYPALIRLSLPPKHSRPPKGFHIWNTPHPPSLFQCRLYYPTSHSVNTYENYPDQSCFLKAVRLNPSNPIEGITFFLRPEDGRPLGMHVHHPGNGNEKNTVLPLGLPPFLCRGVEWIFAPVGKTDRIVGFGMRHTRQGTDDGRGITKIRHAMLLRLKLAGDAVAGYLIEDYPGWMDQCLAQVKEGEAEGEGTSAGPVTLVYGVPHHGIYWEWFGGYDGTYDNEDVSFQPSFPSPPAFGFWTRVLEYPVSYQTIYSWAPLDNVVEAVVSSWQLEGQCRGDHFRL